MKTCVRDAYQCRTVSLHSNQRQLSTARHTVLFCSSSSSGLSARDAMDVVLNTSLVRVLKLRYEFGQASQPQQIRVLQARSSGYIAQISISWRAHTTCSRYGNVV